MGVIGIRLGPEEGEELFAAVEAVREGDGEIGEEGKPLRLHDDRLEVAPVSVTEVEGAQGA